MGTWPEIIFTLVFLGQVFLISWIIPNRVLKRIQYVLDHYPADEYPKLYPWPAAYYRRGLSIFRIASRLILLLGLGLLYLALARDPGGVPKVLPGFYFIIQFLPLMAIELLEFTSLKLMRERSVSSKRRAELRRRNLFSYVSPWLVILAAAAYLLAVGAEAFMPGQVFEWDKVIVLTIGMGLLMAVATFNLYGKKRNPYQGHAERARRVSTVLHTMFYMSIALSGFMIFQSIEDAFALNSIDAIAVSVYMQLLALLSIGTVLRSNDVCDMDFSVYRRDVASG